MGFEARKTNRLRGSEFSARYFAGRVLDIGCGPDPVVPHAIPFDREQGDAGRILDHLPGASFDCVHSSHCLEHLDDVPRVLAEWWQLVRPGGTMILVVPDEDLYEQGYWPSVFNAEHKATFYIDKPRSWSPVGYDLRRLVETLPHCEVVEVARQDAGYDHGLRQRRPSPIGPLLLRLHWKRLGLFRRLGLRAAAFNHFLDRIERRLGKPVDQTGGAALAQIQAVLRRTP